MTQQIKGKQLFESIGSKDYLKYILSNPEQKKFHQIIALFCLLKEYHFETYEQLGFFFTRYARAAKRLEPFPVARIEATIQHLIDDKNINYKIGIETIEKFIMEVACPEEETILILRSGERIKDVKRLKELEQLNKVYYDRGNWYEN